MATFSSQKDLVATFKKETILIVGTLSKLHTMSSELSRDIFKDNALDKPTQNLFHHLSYYLVGIIDNQAARGLLWPLCDTKTERAFRNGLSSIINDYSNKGLLSPVMSSYLINPGCYKVTLLLFQMSQLALQKTLLSKMYKENQKKLYNDMTDMYKSDNKESFRENIEKAIVEVSSKTSNYLSKRKKIEKIANLISKKITEMETKLSSLEAQNYINNLVDGFLKKHEVDEITKKEILNIKNVNNPSKFFDDWLSDCDKKISDMENRWDEKMNPFLKLALDTQCSTEMLIARQTGEADKSTYMLEFNPKTDVICTKELLCEVNSEQQYILKNIIKNDQLNFPNLIRGFLVAVSYIQRNAEHSDEIYKFNEYLDSGRRQYSEFATAMKMLLERVGKAEAKLQPRSVLYSQSRCLKDFIEIPPMPDLSGLKMGKDWQSQNTFDTFTPLNISKKQFNLQWQSKAMLTKPKSLPHLVAPLSQGPSDDFLKSLISCRISSYNRSDTTQNLNMSLMPQTNFKSNETSTECSSGFTKQQITRLLTTKKSSSSKKFKYYTERPNNTNIRKGRLFNESQHTSTESNGLYRSYSSPNLFENRDKKPKIGRKLSKMQEDSPLLEVSRILALDFSENSYRTPQGAAFHNFADVNLSKLHEIALDKEASKTETPTYNSQLIRKTSSLEKIINRFKKVKASVLTSAEIDDDFKTIVEEKDNIEMCTANRVLLPDLLSPSDSILPNEKKSMDYTGPLWLDTDEVVTRKPRESLGTVLGVDHTFLDQFDLID